MTVEPWLVAGVTVVAAAYSMVGHGGASGYLALLAFTSISPKLASTTALVLNVVVAGITWVAFQRARHFDFRLAWPFLVGSIPFAALGGLLHVESRVQDLLLAGTLTYAAVVLAIRLPASAAPSEAPERWTCVGLGAGIGLLSGIIGVGGGIFLSPLMILRNWAKPHTVASVSAVFIWANSVAGLVARPWPRVQESLALWPLIIAGVIGAVVGSWVGAQRVSGIGLRRALAAVLVLAVVKLVLP